MRRRLRLGEFTFDILYNKGNLDTQADALYRLQSLGHSTEPLEEDRPTYPDNDTLTQKQVTLVSKSNVSDYLLLTHGALQDHTQVSITIDEMLQEQQAAHSCCDLFQRLQSSEDVSFS